MSFSGREEKDAISWCPLTPTHDTTRSNITYSPTSPPRKRQKALKLFLLVDLDFSKDIYRPTEKGQRKIKNMVLMEVRSRVSKSGLSTLPDAAGD